ncbi:MAG: FtsX-like permease family protein [Peptococcaceae bacterium]|nr:FtsX-like permease family protein [Peptococcaceae bacterium]
MTRFSDIYAQLRQKNRANYLLLVICCFISVMLIAAYSLMSYSPTVLDVLPDGGDSRKQVMMVYVLTVLGCAVFTIYAAGLFFREKSAETGIFLALGATRAQLARELRKELALVSAAAGIGGAVAGLGVAWGIWQLFRIFVVDSAEMALSFGLKGWLPSLAFIAFVTVMLFVMGGRSVRRTDIIDVVRESHKSEPIRPVPRCYSWLGILLMTVGGLLGYFAPTFFVRVLHWYAPEFLTVIFYLPLFAGLYMLMLHTVGNGWGGRRKRYKDIISVSMMKFQARQTVRNMLVMTLLIAGAFFASFYAPMLGVGQSMVYKNAPVDYLYHYRADQDVPKEDDVRALADQYHVTITDFHEATMLRLAVDGERSVETQTKLGTTYEDVYEEIESSNLFLSASGYEVLTGERVNVAPGTLTAILTKDGNDGYAFGTPPTLVTNTQTGAQLAVRQEESVANDSLYGHYIMNDGDYAQMAAGLNDQWREEMVCFNVKNPDETYDFAKALFNAIVDGSSLDVAQTDGWDPVVREREIAENGSYFMDRDELASWGAKPINYDERNGTEFRTSWMYMPHFRVLDQADFVKTMAVFLMIFIFIAIICFVAVFVIAHTRCLSIAMTNRRVYDDLRHLGAPPNYLRRSATSQIRRVFVTPAVIGTASIYAFYTLIMFANDGRLTAGELAGLGASALVIVGVSALLAMVYRFTRRRVFRILRI